MNVLVIGRGGREHAICWKLCQSMHVTQLYCAPGNAGIEDVATIVDIQETDIPRLIAFAQEHRIDLVVVGPEDPLLAGVVDAFEASGIRAFGPTKVAAQLEGSKQFAKKLMHQYGIPTAAFASFSDYAEARAYVQTHPLPVVIKADGLAAGKGVTIAHTRAEAEHALEHMMCHKQFGQAGERVVIEQFLQGEEMSLLCFVDGKTVVPMPAAQDHKTLYDGDQGPNTGGMGAYSPVAHVPESCVEEALRTIVRPIVAAMAQEGMPFRGVLFAGLMIAPDGSPQAIEFNCRFGDPETQAVLLRLESDLLPVLLAVVEGRLDALEPLVWDDQVALAVVLVAEGYPHNVQKGAVISGIVDVEQSIVFHSGTAHNAQGEKIANGGRLLAVTARATNIEEARTIAYADVARVQYTGKHFRSDIGQKGLRSVAHNP